MDEDRRYRDRSGATPEKVARDDTATGSPGKQRASTATPQVTLWAGISAGPVDGTPQTGHVPRRMERRPRQGERHQAIADSGKGSYLSRLLDKVEASEEPFSAIRLLTTVGCRNALSGKFGR